MFIRFIYVENYEDILVNQSIDFKSKYRYVYNNNEIICSKNNNYIEELYKESGKIDDIIAIKGPINYELDLAFLKNYDIKIFLFKDSGKKGATEDKVKSALELNIDCFIIEREKIDKHNVFYKEKDVFNYIMENYIVKNKNLILDKI